MFRRLESMVDPYVAYEEEDHPPQKLWPFLLRYCQPFRKVFALTAVITVLVAAIEIWLIAYVGRLVDVLAESEPGTFWGEYGFEMLVVGAFLLLLRPIDRKSVV